jgi:hypothetical protein
VKLAITERTVGVGMDFGTDWAMWGEYRTKLFGLCPLLHSRGSVWALVRGKRVGFVMVRCEEVANTKSLDGVVV